MEVVRVPVTFEARQTHVGQYKRYGDFFREWVITTDRSMEETVEWCFNNLYQRRVPPKEEWNRRIVYGGDKWSDMGYYFGGYYSILQIEKGFKFVICEPYAD